MEKVKEKTYVREKNDFVPTPVDCSRAFLKSEKQYLPLNIWEPCCGDGALAKLLPGEVICSDLVDRGYGKPRIDFLMETVKWADAIITNPPFSLNDKFMWHAIELDVSYIAMFHPTTFFNTGMWRDIWKRRPPARVYTLTWRPDIFGIGQPDQRCSYAWSVWDLRYENQCLFNIMEKPR